MGDAPGRRRRAVLAGRDNLNMPGLNMLGGLKAAQTIRALFQACLGHRELRSWPARLSAILCALSLSSPARMTGNRIGGRDEPRSPMQSLLAGPAGRLFDLAWLSDTIRRKGNAAALALSAILILFSPAAAQAADGDGCNYLRGNPASYDNGAYVITSGPVTRPAPPGNQTGIVNYASGTVLYYSYTVSDPSITARLTYSGLSGLGIDIVPNTSTGGSGSFTLPVDSRAVTPSATIPGSGPGGTVTWTVYCAARATQAVPSTTGTVGAAMSFTPVTASFGYGTYSYALSGGTLPSGLSFNTGTGAITGTPTAALAATTFTVTVTHQGTGSASQTFQLAVTAAAPTIVAAFSPTSIASGGSSTLTLTISNPNAATQLTGVAVQASALPANLTGSSPTTNCSAGTATLNGGTGALSLSGAMLNASASCTVSITVSSATPGTYSYTSGIVSASGPSAVSGSTATTPVPLTVTAPAPTVASISPTSGPVAGGTTVTVTGTGFAGTTGASGVRFGGTNAASYTVNSDTQITAVAPAHAAGTVDVTVTAPGGTSATSASDQFTYVAAPVASSFVASALAYDASNATFSVAAHATNSPTSYAVGSATTAQGGSVSVDAAGLVTYNAPVGFRGNDSFIFTATNASGTSSPATVTVPIQNPVLVSTFPVDSGVRGTALSNVRIDTAGGRSPYSCSTTLNSGALPSGTQLNSDCTITGTPAASGSFTFTAVVTDSSLGTGPFTQTTDPLVLTISAPTLTLSPAAGALPDGSVGTGYSQSFTAAGGTSPYTYARTSGTLPTGLTLSGGTLSGTPSAAGTFNFDITATDGSSAGSGGPYSRVQSYSVTITAAPTVTGVLPPSGPVNQVVTVTGTGFSTTPGNNVVMFGPLAGTVTAASATSLTVTAPSSGSGPVAVTVTVNGQPSTGFVTFSFVDRPIAGDMSGVVVAFNSPGTAIDLSGSISGGPHSSIAIGTAASHGTISISGDVVTYTPTAGYSGPDSFTYTATGMGGTSNIGTVSLEVAVAAPTAPTRTIAAATGSTVTIDLTGSATGGPFTGAAVLSVSPADAADVELIEGGTAMNRSYSLRFTSRNNTAQAVTVLYSLSNAGGTSAPLSLIVQLDARDDPSNDPDVRGLEAAETGAARRMAQTQIGNFGRRMEQLHDGRCAQGMGVSLNLGIPMGGSAAEKDDPSRPGWIGRGADGQDTGAAPAANAVAGAEDSASTAAGADGRGLAAGCDDGASLRDPGSIELWTNGAVTLGSRDATSGRDRFDISTSGLTAGADIVLTPAITIGIGGGFGRDQTDVGSNGSEVQANSWVAGAYGSFRPVPGGFIDVLAGAGGIDFDLTRYIGAADSFATAQRNADLLFGSVRAGIDRHDGPWRWSLFGGIEASRTDFGAYVEVGPENHSLAYDARSLDTINGLVGGRFEYSFLWGDTVLTPRGRLEYRYDFEQAEGQRVQFGDWLDGPSFQIDADGWSRSQVTAELGIGATLPTGWRMGADVTGNLSGNSRSIGLRMGISQGF